jgi:hypothetical protein
MCVGPWGVLTLTEGVGIMCLDCGMFPHTKGGSLLNIFSMKKQS